MTSQPPKIAIIDATAAGKGHRRFTRDAIGCGVRSICGILEEENIEVKIFLCEDIIDNGFPTKDFSALFISAMTMDKVAVKKLIKIWRKQFTGKIVLGGPITSELRQVLIDTQADVIVIGEGEFTLKELIQSNYLQTKNSKLLTNIAGIGYFDNTNNTTINPFRKYSTRAEFNTFKPSTMRIKDYPNYFSAKVYVECVRGCSNFGGTKIALPDGRKCSECGYCESDCIEDRANCPSEIPPGCGFCSVPSLFGPARSRSVESIINEIQELLVQGVKRFVLSSPDFLDFARDDFVTPKSLITPRTPESNINKIRELLTKIHSLEPVKNGKAWFEIENIKASLFTEEIAQIFAEFLPKASFSIGCETGSEYHSTLLGKSSSPADVLKAVKLASKYNLHTHIYFIHSLPGQTKETARETTKFIYDLEPFIDKVTIYRFKPLPLSAFGDFPEPEPAIRNPDSKLIAEAANTVNLRKKKNLIGQKVQVIISEPNRYDEKGTIAYILEGGPMVAVENSREKIGEIVTVKIKKALSEKLVLAEIVN